MIYDAPQNPFLPIALPTENKKKVIMPDIEVCIDSAHGANSALSGGVTRLETCAGLSDGGLTPSVGLVKQIDSWRMGARQFVMIRPRAGDFVYSSDEIDIMENDILSIKSLNLPSVKGFVFGCLTADGCVDMTSMRRLVSAARPYAITFHRAVDVAADYDKAFQQVVSLGCDCVLTSGGRAKALEGVNAIQRAVSIYGNKIQIMPGSGVNPTNAQALLSTGVTALHFSAKTRIKSASSLSMGSADAGEGYNSASKETIQQMLRVVHAKL